MLTRVRKKVPEIASFGRGSESAIEKSVVYELRPQGAIFLVYAQPVTNGGSVAPRLAKRRRLKLSCKLKLAPHGLSRMAC